MTNFDTLKAAKTLQDAGVDAQQAEAMVQVVSHALTDGLATKEDLRELEAGLRMDMQGLEAKIDNGLAMVRTEIDSVTQKMTIRLGGIVIGGIAALEVLNRIFPVVPAP